MSNATPFSRRTSWTLNSNKLSNDLERLRRGKVRILDLTESNPTQCGFAYLSDEIIMSLKNENNLCYVPESRGKLKARDAIGQYYKKRGITINSKQIFLTSSTSEAYSYLFRLLVNPEEQVLFPRPSYPLFSFLGDLNDVSIGSYSLTYKKQWEIDLKNLEDNITQDTKALVLVNPNNPTGSYVRHQELKTINTLCQDNKIALISDEVFFDFAFDENKNHPSCVENCEVLTFVLGGISKTLGLPQMKLSWIVINGPQDLVEAASARLEVIADTYLSVNTPTQNALAPWLLQCEYIQKDIKERISQNYDFLSKITKTAHGCSLLATEGGWVAVLKINDALSEENWSLAFLNEEHVYVHPGYFFDFDQETFMVVSLLPPAHVFEEGVKRVLKSIKNKSRNYVPANQTY